MKMALKNADRGKGVTLIEMAVVIGIVLILGTLMIVEYGSMDDKARRSASLVNAKAVGDALRMYKQERRAYTCSLDELMPYINLTTLRTSFLTLYLETDDCSDFKPLTYLRLTGWVKGIVPNYMVNYNVIPQKDPECSSNGAAVYNCKDKW